MPSARERTHSFVCLSPSRGACVGPVDARRRAAADLALGLLELGVRRATARSWASTARRRGRVALARVGVPAAGVGGRRRRCAGRARRARSAASASSARSWETSTTPPARSPQQRREAREPVVVEVVGRLVEEHDVEARRAQGREAGARRLAAGQRAQRAVEQVGAEAELGRGRGEARLGVVAAEREPALERGRVRLDARRGRRPRASRRARRRAARRRRRRCARGSSRARSRRASAPSFASCGR